jgi:hypothetical protein
VPLLLSGLRLVLGKVMGQHRVHVQLHTRFKVGFYPRDTMLQVIRIHAGGARRSASRAYTRKNPDPNVQILHVLLDIRIWILVRPPEPREADGAPSRTCAHISSEFTDTVESSHTSRTGIRDRVGERGPYLIRVL